MLVIASAVDVVRIETIRHYSVHISLSVNNILSHRVASEHQSRAYTADAQPTHGFKD